MREQVDLNLRMKQLAFVSAFGLMACCLCPPALFAEAPAALSDAEFLKLARNSTPEEVMRAVKNGADVNAKDKNDRTVLMEAALETDNPETVKILLAAGADKSAKDKEGHDALWYAEHSGNLLRGLKEDERRKVDTAIIQLLEEAMKNAKAR